MKKIDNNKLNGILRIIIFVLLILIVVLGAVKHCINTNNNYKGEIYENN